MKAKILQYCSLLALSIGTISCADFVQIDPPKTQIVSESVFASDATANAVMIGIYSEMLSTRGFASGDRQSISFITGLSADEFEYPASFNPVYTQFYENALLNNNTVLQTTLWQGMYKCIYYANAVIEGVSKSSVMTMTVKKQLEGEAKFIRAFCHFYLVNLWGNVPIVTSTDYRINSKLSRSAVQDVYTQIITDLQDAVVLLPSDYSVSGNERIRPNAWAAKALLARTYLFKEDWVNAELMATEIINNTGMYSLSALNGVFLANSREAIWQLKPVEPGFNTYEADMYRIASIDNFFLPDRLMTSFEPGDLRKTNWTANASINGKAYAFPFKYKVGNRNMPVIEYSTVFRLAEQYLIRAEARARQNKLTEARADVNVIRNRADLVSTVDVTKDQLLVVIEQERRIELFSEWGHRWLDLKRTGRATAVLSPIKSGWHINDVSYPIPQSEILNNSNLNQNQGY